MTDSGRPLVVSRQPMPWSISATVEERPTAK